MVNRGKKGEGSGETALKCIIYFVVASESVGVRLAEKTKNRKRRK
jgi:hypothetical protein